MRSRESATSAPWPVASKQDYKEAICRRAESPLDTTFPACYDVLQSPPSFAVRIQFVAQLRTRVYVRKSFTIRNYEK